MFMVITKVYAKEKASINHTSVQLFKLLNYGLVFQSISFFQRHSYSKIQHLERSSSLSTKLLRVFRIRGAEIQFGSRCKSL